MKTLLPLMTAAIVLTACGREDESRRADAPVPTGPSAPDTQPAASSATSVQLNATQGNTATGMLAVAAAGEGVHLTGTLQGLKPDTEFGFHIHEKGDCSAPDASSAGEHFNPAGAQHGNPSGEVHHAGDMLNVKSDGDGRAKVDAHAAGVSLNTGQPNDVIGKAVVLHEKADDYTTQPSGDSGARIACGVIT
jgi:Cu-Zn family superoxide dismutase